MLQAGNFFIHGLIFTKLYHIIFRNDVFGLEGLRATYLRFSGFCAIKLIRKSLFGWKHHTDKRQGYIYFNVRKSFFACRSI